MTEDNLEVHAAYSQSDISTSKVNEIVSKLESTAMQIAERDPIKPINGGLSSTFHGDDRRVFKVPPSLEDESYLAYDEKIFKQLVSIVSRFLSIDEHLITADTSLIALGMDSIRSVGLSRALRQEGITLSSADIMRTDTPRKMAGLVTGNISAEARLQVQMQRVDAAFKEQCETLRRYLSPDNLRLAADDEVEVIPATTLQTGMLTQVRCLSPLNQMRNANIEVDGGFTQ